MSEHGSIAQQFKAYKRLLSTTTPPDAERTRTFVGRLVWNRRPETYGKILEAALQSKRWDVARDIITSLDARKINALSWESPEVVIQRENERAAFVVSQCKATISLLEKNDLPPEDKARCVTACLRWDSSPETEEEKNAERQQEAIIGHCAGLAKNISSAAVQIKYCRDLLDLARPSDECNLIALGEVRDALKANPQGQEWGSKEHIEILSLGIDAAARASRIWCRCESISPHEAKYYQLEEEIVGALKTRWENGRQSASTEKKEEMGMYLGNWRSNTYFRRAPDEALDTFIQDQAEALGIYMPKEEPYLPECVVLVAKNRHAPK